MRIKFLILVCAILPSIALPCEDTVPGALPPGFWGGVIEPFRESKVQSGENAAKDESQLFFEAVYRGNEIRLYGLAIRPPKTSIFSKLPPQELSEIHASVEFPWEGRTEELSLSVLADALIGRLDAQNTHRFIVHLRAVHQGKTKFANLQVENGD